MRTNFFAILSLGIAATFSLAAEEKAYEANPELARQISRYVGKLNDDRAAERDAAEKKLLELAGTSTAESDRFLAALPKPNDQMPLAVRERLGRIRQQVEERAAKAATAATTVTLSAKQMSVIDALKALEAQTGNKFIDNREQDGAQPGAKEALITLELKKEPYWQALDKILDEAKLGIYSYGGTDALSIVPRDKLDAPRQGRASYSGPFRMDILDVQAQRSLKQPRQSSLKLQLEVAWEPRLRPIAITQPAADLHATTDAGSELSVSEPKAMLDVEIPNGTQAAEIALPFNLPGRDVKKISSIKCKLLALVPGRVVKFQFGDLANVAGKSQHQGGVQVTVDDVHKNNAVWEVHMKFALDEDNGALQSHRNWVFQNLSYMVDKSGQRIDNGGLEKTHESKNEVGIAYVFDLPSGLDGLSWVYETPAAIVELPVDFEIKNIDLP